MPKTNQEKLDDVHWILAAPDGRPALMDMIASAVTDRIFNTPIQRQGEGASIGDGKTTLGGMVAWNDSHVIGTIAAVAAGAAQSGATAEEIEAVVRKAMAEGVVKVNVTVAGQEPVQ